MEEARNIIRYTTLFWVCLSLGGCSSFFFFPAKHHVQTPSAYALPYKDIKLVAEDGTQLHAWFLPVRQDVRGNVLFLHGNAENISTHMENIRWLPEAGYQVLLLDYRGFGHSGGVPKLPDVFLDIHAAVNWMQHSAQTEGQPFFILGQSIGASLMLHQASKYIEYPLFCGLISDAAFSRYRHIAGHIARQSWITWLFHFPVFWRGFEHYDPVDGVAKLAETPILFFHSKEDEIVPFSNLDLLVKRHSGYHQRVVTSGPHTATFMSAFNRQVLLDFFSQQDCSF